MFRSILLFCRLYLRDTHYIIRDDSVQIVDEFTGRVFASRRWTDNIHQAVEAKEGLDVSGEQVSAATITYQSFFKLYPKLAGMTGTARTEEEELWRTYRLEVVTVPPHRRRVRVDEPTAVFKDVNAKWLAITEMVLQAYERGTPVLVGTTSVEHSELLSDRLTAIRVPHNLLNARAQYEAQEAAIVVQVSTHNCSPVCFHSALTHQSGGSSRRCHDRHQHGWPRHRYRVGRLSGRPRYNRRHRSAVAPPGVVAPPSAGSIRHAAVAACCNSRRALCCCCSVWHDRRNRDGGACTRATRF